LTDQRESLISHLHDKFDEDGLPLFTDANEFSALSVILENMLNDIGTCQHTSLLTPLMSAKQAYQNF
jgi:hypothetical protein